MILYHGGLEPIQHPVIMKGERVGDFGVGFYTTTDLDQAKRFVKRKCAVAGKDIGSVSVYSVPDDVLSSSEFSIRCFQGPSDEWVEFVFANRRVPLYEHGFDLVYGPVANDQVYASLSLFEDGQIGHEELIRRLRTRRLADQLLFHTERSLSLLKYTDSMEVSCRAK